MWQRFAGVVFLFSLAVGVQAAEDAQKTQDKEQLVKRGEYIVHHVAMCIYCHTPKDVSGNLKTQELLTGAPMPVRSPYPSQTWGFMAPNLRSLPTRWGQEEFIRFLQTGKAPNGYSPRPPMPPFRMNQDDAAAVAAYLDSVIAEE